MKKEYICTGTCGARISEEEYEKGLTKCGAKGCTKEGMPFEEKWTEDETPQETNPKS